jgi:hypothetical protein
MDNALRARNTWLLCRREKSGAVRCPGRCACIDVPGDPEPHRYLSEAPLAGGEGLNVRRLAWSTQVDFCATSLPLTTFAAFLASAFPGQVYVPGEKVYASVSNELDGVTLAQVAREAGLCLSDVDRRPNR